MGMKAWHEITVEELRQRIKEKGGPLHIVEDFDELLITADDKAIHFIIRDDKGDAKQEAR